MFSPRGQVHIVVCATLLGLASCGPQGKRSHTHALAAVMANPEVQKLTGGDGRNQLVLTRRVNGEDLYSEVYEHRVSGLKVLGSEVRYHEAATQEAVVPQLATVYLSPVPGLDFSTIIAIVRRITGGVMIEDLGEPVYLPRNQKSPERLIYRVRIVNGDEVWVDANSGAHLATLSGADAAVAPVRSAKRRSIVMVHLRPSDAGEAACAVLSQGAQQYKTLNIAQCQARAANACQILNREEQPQTLNPDRCDLAKASDQSAVRAKENAQRFLDYLKTSFGRDSYDGRGAEIVSIVHVGRSYANAGWYKREKYIAYGDGDGSTLRDFTFARDIAGHEMTHALIASTAGLLSFGESGAVNESIADYFGGLIEGKGDWAIGEDLYIDRGAGQALRDLQDPARLKGPYFTSAGVQEAPYPAHRRDEQFGAGTCLPGNDYCGVHYNATIPGHAWYLLHQRLGQAKTEKLLYYSLTHFFGESVDFLGAATGVLRACDMLGFGGDCEQVRDVFKSTGML